MAISRRTFLIRSAEVGLGVAAVGLVGRGSSTAMTTTRLSTTRTRFLHRATRG